MTHRQLDGCIWCGQLPFTQEHLLPQWTSRIVKLSENTRTQTNWQPGLRDGRTVSKQGNPFTLRPRIVCQKCNGGWMSALEQAAIPVLSPLILGETSHIEPTEVEILTRWLVKTVYVSQGIGSWFADTNEMQTFAQLPHEIPLGFKAWLGSWSEGEGADVWTHAWECRPSGDPRTYENNSHWTMLAVGRVFFATLRTPAPEYEDFDCSDAENLWIKPLWPTATAVSWPTSMEMNHALALELRRSFSNGLDIVTE